MNLQARIRNSSTHQRCHHPQAARRAAHAGDPV